jgi:hypothetical protein
LPAQAGIALPDQALDFGVMKVGLGRAFLIGDNTNTANVLVGKQWVQVGNRQILVEEVPVEALANQLGTLPPPGASAATGTAIHPVASRQWQLPPPHLAKAGRPGQFRRTVAAMSPKRGLVLDYQTLNSSQTNYTFQGDTTYYISGAVNLCGTNTFEGGAVLKYTNNASLNLSACAQINCLTAPYRPVIFTAKDDNSVGVAINGSTGSPLGSYYANPAIYYFPSGSGSLGLSHFRIAYANEAVFASAPSMGVSLSDGQIVNCNIGFYTPGQTGASLENMLFANVQVPLELYIANVQAQNVTFIGSYSELVAPAGSGPNYPIQLGRIPAMFLIPELVPVMIATSFIQSQEVA